MAKIQKYYLPEPPSGPESTHLLSNPAYALQYINSARDANFYTQSIYGNLADNNMGNAFSIRNILMNAPASETQAIDFTQDGTSAHEMDSNGQIHTIHSAMDLHNNMSARVWMEKETKWGIGPLRSMPDYNDIMDEFMAKASIATHYNHIVDPLGAYSLILGAHGGNNSTTWNNLFNNLYGPFEHLIRIE